MATNIGTMRVTLEASTAAFTRGMTGASESITKVTSAMKGIGIASGLVAAKVGLVSGAATKAFSSFEDAITEVGAVSETLGTDTFDKLSQKALQLGKTTQFSAAEAAQGMQFMAQAGVAPTQIIEEMADVLNLAAAASLDLGSAADIATNIQAAFASQNRKLVDVNDILISTTTKTNTNMVQLADAMKFVGPIAANAGVSIEDTSAAIGLLSNAGIQASTAGTGLRGILAAMVQTSGPAKKAFDELGVQMVDSQGRFVGLSSAIEQLQPIANDTGKLLSIFGDRAGPAMAVLLQSGSDALDNLGDKLRNSAGAASKIAEAKMKTFTGSMNKMKSAIEGLAISFGRELAPHIKRTAARIGEIATIFNEMSPETKKFAARITIMAGALASAGVAVGLLGAALEPFQKALFGAAKGMTRLIMRSLGLLAPLAGIALAVAGLVTAIGFFRQAWVANMSGMQEVTKKFVSGATKAFDQLRGAMRTISKAGVFLAKTFGVIGEEEAFDIMREMGKAADEEFGQNIIDVFGDIKDAAVPVAKLIGGSFKDAFMEGVGFLQDSFGPAAAELGSVLQGKLKDALASGGITDELFKQLKGALDRVLGAGTGGGSRRGGAAGAAASVRPAQIAAEGIFASAKQRIGEAFNDVSMFIAQPPFQIFAGLAAGAEVAGENLAMAGKQMASKLMPTGEQLSATATMAGDQFLGALGEAGSSINAAIQGAEVGGPIGAIVAFFVDLATKTEGFGDIIGVVTDLMTDLTSIMNPLMKVITPIIKTLGEMLTPIIAQLGTVFASLVPFLEFLGRVLIDAITPLMEALGTLLEGLAPLLAIVTAILEPIINALMMVLKPQLEAFAFVIKFVGKVFEFVARLLTEIFNAIVTLWNSVIGAIQGILRSIGDLKIAGKKPFGFLSEWADGLEKSKGETFDLAKATKEAQGVALDSIRAGRAKNEQDEDLIDNTKKVNEQLQNVPSGFKIALERFRATTGAIRPDLIPNAMANTGDAFSVMADTGAKQVFNFNDPTIIADSPEEFAAEAQRMAERESMRNTGNPTTIDRFAQQRLAGGG